MFIPAQEPQTGELASISKYVVLFVLIFIFIIICMMLLNTQQPYVKIINYIYKSNLYKEFELPSDYDVKTQGRVWSNWDTDQHGIKKVCDLFNSSMGYFNNNHRSPKAKAGIKVVEDWIVAFLSQLEETDVVNPDYQGLLWGTNWYEFSISAPTMLAYYIVNKASSNAIAKCAAKAIQYLIRNPQLSLGYVRDKANSAMMLFPWTLSHMITGTLDKTNEGFIYAVEQYNLAPNQNIKANDDGVHLDYSYLTHSGVYAYGYLWSIYNIYPDTKQILDEVKKFDLDRHIDMIYSKLRHPKIDTAGCALWHRQFRLNGSGYYTGKTKTNNCSIIPSMRYIRYFDDNIHFSARTMQTTVAYYEADHDVDNMGLYSALCRRIFREGDDPKPKFPDVGFIYPKGTTELIQTPSTTTTTEPFFCELGPESKSYVWTDGEEYGVLFQYKMKLPPLLPVEFTEVFCIYLKEKRIESHYRIEPDTSIYLDKEYTRETGNDVDAVDGYIVMKTDLQTGERIVSLGPNETSHSGWYMPRLEEFTNNKYRAVPNDDKTSAFIIQKRTVIGDWERFSYTPGEEEIMQDTIIVDGNEYYFDANLNQYQAKWD